jgi:hypothetical protein
MPVAIDQIASVLNVAALKAATGERQALEPKGQGIGERYCR